MRVLVHDYAGHPFEVQLSRELARRGHGVTHAFAGGLLTPRGALQKTVSDPKCLDIIEVPMTASYRNDKYNFFKRHGYEVEYGRELDRYIAANKPNVVISANTPSEPQWTLVRACHRLGIPVVSWVQDIYSEAVKRLAREKLPVFGSLVGAYYGHLDARCLRGSAAVVAISEDFKPRLTSLGAAPECITVIPNWAPLDELPLRPKDNAWARRHGLNGKFVFLYSGTLAMKHNPALLQSVARRFRERDDVRVVVISEGPGADYLAAAKQTEGLGNLILLPYQDFTDLPEVLAAADVLIAVLERSAGVFSVPSKVLTYHAAGRAILAAMPGENLAAKIVCEEGSGICVEPDDEHGFTAGAGRLLEDSDLRNQAARRARLYAEKNFDITAIGDRFERILSTVTGQVPVAAR
jgi:glycosyltransferase involved in cell wall biosynthesis